MVMSSFGQRLFRRGLRSCNAALGKFKVLNAAADTNSAAYKTNFEYNSELVNQLKEKLRVVMSNSDAKAVERHTLKNKKLLVKDRLALLFDNVNDVLELSPLAGLDMPYGNVPRAGIVTGILLFRV